MVRAGRRWQQNPAKRQSPIDFFALLIFHSSFVFSTRAPLGDVTNVPSSRGPSRVQIVPKAKALKDVEIQTLKSGDTPFVAHLFQGYEWCLSCSPFHRASTSPEMAEVPTNADSSKPLKRGPVRGRVGKAKRYVKTLLSPLSSIESSVAFLLV